MDTSYADMGICKEEEVGRLPAEAGGGREPAFGLVSGRGRGSKAPAQARLRDAGVREEATTRE
jgi:hypothetical protein